MTIDHSLFDHNTATRTGLHVFVDCGTTRCANPRIAYSVFQPVNLSKKVYIGGALAGCREHPCSPGHLCDYTNYSLWCSKCPDGTFGGDGFTCKPCSAGSGPNANQTGCEVCSGTTYSATGTCQECPAPNVVRDRNTTCSSCKAGKEPNTFRTACQPCARGTYSKKGAECLPCDEATFSAEEGQSTCTQCPLADVHGIKHFIAKEACPGTALSAGQSCRQHYTGVLCMSCAENSHRLWDGTCEPCSRAVAGRWIAPLVLLIVVLCCTLGARLWRRRRMTIAAAKSAASTLQTSLTEDHMPETVERGVRHWDERDTQSSTLTSSNPLHVEGYDPMQLAWDLERWSADGWLTSTRREWRRSCSRHELILLWRCALQPFRIVITYLQVASQLSSVLHVQYPKHFSQLLHSMKASLSILTWLFSPECAGLTDFKAHWMLHVVGLPVMLLLLAILYTGIMLGTRANAEAYRGLLQKQLFFVIFFTYPTVCKEVFATFNCLSLETAADNTLKSKAVLATDDRVFCDDIFVWHFLSALVIGGIGFGVPFAFGGILWHKMRHDEISSENPAVQRIAKTLCIEPEQMSFLLRDLGLSPKYDFLLDAYKPQCYYWETCEVVRKLALVGLVILADQGSVEQIICAAALCVLFLVLQVSYMPYKTQYDNRFRLLTELPVLMTILLAFALHNREAGEEAKVSNAALDWALMASTVLCVPVAFFTTVIIKFRDAKQSMTDNSIAATICRFELGLATASDRATLDSLCQRLRQTFEQEGQVQLVHNVAFANNVERMKTVIGEIGSGWPVSARAAILDCRTILGYTPLMIARECGCADIAALLEANGCTLDLVNTSGQTANDLRDAATVRDEQRHLTPWRHGHGLWLSMDNVDEYLGHVEAMNDNAYLKNGSCIWNAKMVVVHFDFKQMQSLLANVRSQLPKSQDLALHFTDLDTARHACLGCPGLRASAVGQLGGGLSVSLSLLDDFQWAKGGSFGGTDANFQFAMLVAGRLWGTKWYEVMPWPPPADLAERLIELPAHDFHPQPLTEKELAAALGNDKHGQPVWGSWAKKLEAAFLVRVPSIEKRDQARILPGRPDVYIIPQSECVDFQHDTSKYYPTPRIEALLIVQVPDAAVTIPRLDELSQSNSACRIRNVVKLGGVVNEQEVGISEIATNACIADIVQAYPTPGDLRKTVFAYTAFVPLARGVESVLDRHYRTGARDKVLWSESVARYTADEMHAGITGVYELMPRSHTMCFFYTTRAEAKSMCIGSDCVGGIDSSRFEDIQVCVKPPGELGWCPNAGGNYKPNVSRLMGLDVSHIQVLMVLQVPTEAMAGAVDDAPFSLPRALFNELRGGGQGYPNSHIKKIYELC